MPPMRFDGTLGAMFISEILIVLCYGIATMQAYTYFRRSRSDHPVVKTSIFLLWILDGLHLFLFLHTMYGYFVSNFMNPVALTECPWSLAVDMAIGDLSELIMNVIFAHRIYKLSGGFWPALAVIIIPSLVSFAGALAITVLALKVPPFAAFRERYAWIWFATFSLQAFTDCAITAALSIILANCRTGFQRTNSLLRFLVAYSTCTCAFTSSLAIASVITYSTMPNSFVFFSIAALVPKLLLNSLLALLNSRDMLRNSYAGQVASIHVSRLEVLFASDSTHKFPDTQGKDCTDGRVERAVTANALRNDLADRCGDREPHAVRFATI
ncbi:hypothetical protein PsYK624_101690 [Phanerochaete sordida]|uniref:DUF6534 domain-containing protein n=1 Tax=Phanerochaete sordida TaxID=48140 RepID=A0A9P3LFY2_9APHY|nr:hypothetical protein PsYK624_101690 [Phanerochaete sordida]